jgi:hypothetical protein
MTRREILAEVLAHLEAERFAPGPREPRMVTNCDPPQPITKEQAAANLRKLGDAVGSDEHLWGVA